MSNGVRICNVRIVDESMRDLGYKLMGLRFSDVGITIKTASIPSELKMDFKWFILDLDLEPGDQKIYFIEPYGEPDNSTEDTDVWLLKEVEGVERENFITALELL